MDLGSVIFVLAALIVRGVLLLRDSPFVIPRRVTSWLAVVYFLLFFVDFFLFSARDWVAPAVHLSLFVMCVKLFNVERERDYAYLRGAFVSDGLVGRNSHRGFGFSRRVCSLHGSGSLLLHGHGDAPLLAIGAPNSADACHSRQAHPPPRHLSDAEALRLAGPHGTA